MPIHISSQLPDLLLAEASWAPNGDSHPGDGDQLPKVRHLEKNVTLLFDPPLSNNVVPGKGDLYVAESQLIWHNPATALSIAIDYRSIGIHAISRGNNTVGGPGVYGQLDEVVVRERRVEAINPNGELDDSDVESTEEIREFWLVPDASSSLDAVFQALSDCASLHPDPDAEEDEYDMNECFYTADNPPPELNANQTAALESLESKFTGEIPESKEQFADANEDVLH
ncbi:regulator of volume decrease after cellular swelling-domain-containing protein [Phlyctochytrium arcticum]|nr:regulator of volume decrease after cellular swelling-domain-containing protein [Phlyctochytrium arcticum]